MLNRRDRMRYMAMSLTRLRKLRTEIQGIIEELEANPARREIDIAAEHSGKSALIQEIIRHRPQKGRGWLKRLEKVYCSPQGCSKCPHGPFWFTYRTNKRSSAMNLVAFSEPAFPDSLIKELRYQARPFTPYEILSDDLGRRKK